MSKTVALPFTMRTEAPRVSARARDLWMNATNPRDRGLRVGNAVAEATPVYLYDMIGEWGVTASDFVAALGTVTTKSIDMHINSPGGDVFDGVAIHAALVNHPATVNVLVDGIAASAASFIAMAGDTIGIEKPATMMIHDAQGLVWGNQADMLKAAAIVGQLSDTIAGVYADRAGGTPAAWRAAMLDETWYTSAEAVAAGLADSVLNDNAPPAPDPAPAEDRATQLIRARARVTLRG